MTTTSASDSKKFINNLQKAIVKGLEDIKAVGISVFDTTELTPLFERVIIASANSSRQTKALAQSVLDKVVEAGFDRPRNEGQENGEWIIVDCGAAVVHIMQPAIREYYRLEEIWGDKPISLIKRQKKTEKIEKTEKPKASKKSKAAEALSAPEEVKKKAPTAKSRAKKVEEPSKPVKKTSRAKAKTEVTDVPEGEVKKVARKKAAVKKDASTEKEGTTTEKKAPKKATTKKKAEAK